MGWRACVEPSAIIACDWENSFPINCRLISEDNW